MTLMARIMLKCGVTGTGTGSCKNPVKSIKIKVLPNACWLSARFQLEVSLTPMMHDRCSPEWPLVVLDMHNFGIMGDHAFVKADEANYIKELPHVLWLLALFQLAQEQGSDFSRNTGQWQISARHSLTPLRTRTLDRIQDDEIMSPYLITRYLEVVSSE